MNAFPDDYLVHNLPLIVLSGLGEEQNDQNATANSRTLLKEGGFRIKTDLPVVQGGTAQALLQTLLGHDSTNKPWHARGVGPTDQNAVFRIHTTGRAYTLPPRKAPPPAHSPRLRPAFDDNSLPPQLVLHSTISPLTPSSPLYPDGIMTPLWITKHQSRLPSIFMAFFSLVSDPNTSTLQDNKTKSEISSIRSVLSSANYKTRLVVVFVGDGSMDALDVEERLVNIRRAANLDTKSLFFLTNDASSTEIDEFCNGLLNSLYAGCMEYYRDLSKHARRKRNRNVVPQPTVQPSSGTSQTLSLSGWNVRYEFKLGVFAEFRQEMEAALRSYEAAYENLFGAEVIETIPSWSPRFNEARLLSDILSIKIIRCILWLGQTMNAVKWWSNHRNRMQSLVDRRGAGTESYGWEAWQSIWSKTMAELIERAQVLVPLSKSTSGSPSLPLYVDNERTLPAGQRWAPWENLHHEGYWLNLAQRYTQNRRTRASRIPEEDRAPPGQSPASMIASKAHLYDKYLVQEPYQEFPVDGKSGYDYNYDITQTLDKAVQYFSQRGQARMVEVLQLKKASELMKTQLWDEAIAILQSVWESQSWRRAGWWILLEQVGRSLLSCAVEVDQTERIARLRWELAHPTFSQKQSEVKAENDTGAWQRPTDLQVALDSEHSLARFATSFVFAGEEGHVGEDMNVQISLQHTVQDKIPPLQLSQVKVVFDGGLKPIYLIDDREQITDDNQEGTVFTEVELQDADSRVAATRRSSFGAAAAVGADVNLALQPGQTKVFQMQVHPREAGDVSVASITMTFEENGCEMTITTSETNGAFGQWWEMRRGKPTPRPCGRLRDTAAMKVLPKPPKIGINIPEMPKVFYTNESIDLVIQITNGEDQLVSGSIEARLLSPGKNNIRLKWKDAEEAIVDPTVDSVASVQRLPTKEIQEIAVGSNTSYIIAIDQADEAIDHELEIAINYTLSSNAESKLNKFLATDISIIRPFEANFSFHSRLHKEEWPNFFSVESIADSVEQAVGLKQHYFITAVVASFTAEDVLIKSTKLTTQKVVGGATCAITDGTLLQVNNQQHEEAGSLVPISPEESKRFGFEMTLQKVVLGDRQPVAVDVLLEIQWQRKGSEQVNTSVLQVPRFLAPSAEPRVLLQVAREVDVAGLYRLDYTIENPSLHFLTFNLTMESNEEFAFSGTKSKSISLVPVSRHDVVYRILPSKSKAWIGVHLEVIDAYFGQTLRVQPASDGIKVDKQGNVHVWID